MTGRLNHRRRAGFTLIEMLVVLALLAITTTIAVQSLAPLADQARYETTQHSLAAIRRSVIGTSVGADGAVSVSGVLADAGVFPVVDDTSLQYAIGPSGNPLAPAQPWTLDFEAEASDDGTVDTEMFAGWNGPYVRPPVGQQHVLDGWGRPFVFPTSFSPLTAVTPYSIISAGPDGQVGTADDFGTYLYPNDYCATSLTLSLVEQVASGSGGTNSTYTRQATLQATPQGTELSFWVVAFTMQAGTGAPAGISAIGPLSTTLIGVTQTAVPVSLPNTTQYPQLPLLIAGPVALRAYTSSSATTLSTSASNGNVVRSTQPIVVTLTPRSSVTKTLLFP